MASGETIAAGTNLLNQVANDARTFEQHPGDVVEVHFFGHSRGTVVVSQALEQFANRQDPTLVGSYVEVTLLDIHPANSSENNLLDYNPLSVIGLVDYAAVALFDPIAADPEVTLPAGAGIMEVDIWFQHTLCSSFPNSNSESAFNLWGESQASNSITNRSGVQPSWNCLTNQSTTQTGVIGHSEIHEYYRIFQVDQGLVH